MDKTEFSSTAKTRTNSVSQVTRKCVYETLCPQPYACPEKRFKSERSATQTIKKVNQFIINFPFVPNEKNIILGVIFISQCA